MHGQIVAVYGMPVGIQYVTMHINSPAQLTVYIRTYSVFTFGEKA